MFNLTTNSSKRYSLTNFIAPVDNKSGAYFDITDSLFLRRLKGKLVYSKYYVRDEHHRPDLLSERIYGTGNTQYWWILMYLNNLRSFTDLKSGIIIHAPTLSSLEDILFSLQQSSVIEKLKSKNTGEISNSIRLM